MILNQASIETRQLVRNAQKKSYRPISYDLAVGQVITPKGDVVTEYPLEPQGIIKVVSLEIVELPANVTGYVHVKTSLCNEGILALNIGIVDPGFSGPLQCTLVNFGKRRYRLKAGTIFGRITFHENEPISDLKGDSRTLQQVTEIAQDDVRKYLASDFLNFSKTVRKAAKQATSQYRDMLLWWLPLFATLLAGLTLFLNFQNLSRLERYINVEDRATELKHQEDLESRIRSLESDRAALQRQLEQLGTNSTLTGGDSQTESNVKSPRK